MQHKTRQQTWSESTEKGLVDMNEMLDFGHNMGLGEFQETVIVIIRNYETKDMIGP